MKMTMRVIATAACLASVSALVLAGLPMKPVCSGAYAQKSVRVQYCYSVGCGGHPTTPFLYEGECYSWCCPDSWQSGRIVELSGCLLRLSNNCCPPEGPIPTEGCPAPPEH